MAVTHRKRKERVVERNVPQMADGKSKSAGEGKDGLCLGSTE